MPSWSLYFSQWRQLVNKQICYISGIDKQNEKKIRKGKETGLLEVAAISNGVAVEDLTERN